MKDVIAGQLVRVLNNADVGFADEEFVRAEAAQVFG